MPDPSITAAADHRAQFTVSADTGNCDIGHRMAGNFARYRRIADSVTDRGLTSADVPFCDVVHIIVFFLKTRRGEAK